MYDSKDLSYLEHLQPFICVQCKKGWEIFDDYQTHMKRHKIRYRCIGMLSPGARWGYLTSYQNAQSNPSSKKFRHTPTMTSYVVAVKRADIKKCSICSKIYKTRSAFKNHARVHKKDFHRKYLDGHRMQKTCANGKKSSKNCKDNEDCSACNSRSIANKDTEDKATLRRSRRPSDTIRRFANEDLEEEVTLRRSKRRNHLKNQRDTQNREKTAPRQKYEKEQGLKLICSFCGRNFTMRHVLKQHIECHKAKDNPYQCLYCTVQYKNAKHLKNHVSSFHSKGKADAKERQKTEHVTTSATLKIECKTCGKEFQNAGKLSRHVYKRHQHLKFVCQSCGNQCRDNTELKRHTSRNHSRKYDNAENKKVFKCRYKDCSKQFTQRHRRVEHEKVHLNAPKKCPKCGDIFQNQSELVKHSQVHSEEKPHQCNYCKLRYKRVGDRNRHERTHTGIQLKTCRFCGRGCRDKHLLDKHERTHAQTKVRPFSCDRCSKRFATKFILTQHLIRIHDRNAIENK